MLGAMPLVPCVSAPTTTQSLTVSHVECQIMSHRSKDIIQPLYFACEETKIVNGLGSVEQTKIQVFVYITFYPSSV